MSETVAPDSPVSFSLLPFPPELLHGKLFKAHSESSVSSPPHGRALFEVGAFVKPGGGLHARSQLRLAARSLSLRATERIPSSSPPLALQAWCGCETCPESYRGNPNTHMGACSCRVTEDVCAYPTGDKEAYDALRSVALWRGENDDACVSLMPFCVLSLFRCCVVFI